MLSPGRLRNRVTIRRLTTARVSGGGRSESWADVATIWAEVIGISGREAVIAEALQGVSFYKITIRWRPDITDADQLRYGAIDLNIRSASDPDGYREELLILADTGSAQGTA